MTVTLPPGPPHTANVEALIEAARRRQRRRRRLVALLVAVVVIAGTAGYLTFRSAGGGQRTSSGPSRAASGRSGAAIRLERPGALALGSRGVLYIADEGRNQILERLPNGSFRIVAGIGKAGFSGDGGPAVRARLNMPRGMAIGRDDTLYFADTGNNRIRAIAPNGIVSTIVGNGKYGWVRSGTPARAATLLSPSAVAIGPDGRLYIADSGDNEVLRLERNSTVTEIAGNWHYAGAYGVGRPVVNASPDGPSGLAFDRAGNLYLAGFNTKMLLMITPKGIMTLPTGIGAFYPRGEGDLVAVPDGSVLAANTLAIVRLTPHGMVPIFDFSRKPFAGVTNFLPEGIAVAPNGDIYMDTSNGNGYANKTALVVVRPGKKPRVLWKG